MLYAALQKLLFRLGPWVIASLKTLEHWTSTEIGTPEDRRYHPYSPSNCSINRTRLPAVPISGARASRFRLARYSTRGFPAPPKFTTRASFTAGQATDALPGGNERGDLPLALIGKITSPFLNWGADTQGLLERRTNESALCCVAAHNGVPGDSLRALRQTASLSGSHKNYLFG